EVRRRKQQSPDRAPGQQCEADHHQPWQPLTTDPVEPARRAELVKKRPHYRCKSRDTAFASARLYLKRNCLTHSPTLSTMLARSNAIPAHAGVVAHREKYGLRHWGRAY